MSEISQDIVDAIVENKSKDDNDLLSIIIGMGVKFNKAKGVLNTVLEEQGLRMSKADRDAKAEELLENFSVTTETTAEEVAEQVEVLVEELDIKVPAARSYIRAMFTEQDIDMPKAVRASSGPRAPRAPGFAGDMKLAADFAIANPEALADDEEAFKTFMDENGGSTTKGGADKSKRWHGGVVDLRIFAKAWKDAGNCQ